MPYRSWESAVNARPTWDYRLLSIRPSASGRGNEIPAQPEGEPPVGWRERPGADRFRPRSAAEPLTEGEVLAQPEDEEQPEPTFAALRALLADPKFAEETRPEPEEMVRVNGRLIPLSMLRLVQTGWLSWRTLE
jgi:hypothetical protein